MLCRFADRAADVRRPIEAVEEIVDRLHRASVRFVASDVKAKRTAQFAKIDVMDEQHQRLQKARSRAGFLNASEAARSFGWNENTYRSHENGERGLKVRVAQDYAKAFGVDPGWLITGTGEPGERYESGVDIVGLIGAKGVIQTSFDKNQFAVRSLPFRPFEDLLAYVVLTHSLNPYGFGDLLLTGSDIPFGVDKFDAIVYHSDGRGRFGSYLKGKRGKGLLLARGDLVEFDEGEPTRVEPVQIVVPAGFHTLRQPLVDLGA